MYTQKQGNILYFPAKQACQVFYPSKSSTSGYKFISENKVKEKFYLKHKTSLST